MVFIFEKGLSLVLQIQMLHVVYEHGITRTIASGSA